METYKKCVEFKLKKSMEFDQNCGQQQPLTSLNDNTIYTNNTRPSKKLEEKFLKRVSAWEKKYPRP